MGRSVFIDDSAYLAWVASHRGIDRQGLAGFTMIEGEA
jgi:hypothetical protein